MVAYRMHPWKYAWTHRPTHSNVHHSAEKLLRSITSRKYQSLHTNRVQWEQYYTDERIRYGQRLLLVLLWLEHQTFSCQSRPFLCLHQCMSHTDTILMHLSTVMSYKLHYCKLHNICKHACTVCMHVRTLVYWYIPFSCIQCKPHSRWGSVFPWQPVCS